MKTNSLNPFDLILGRTLKQKLERQRKKLDNQMLECELRFIKLEGDRDTLSKQIDFLDEGEATAPDNPDQDYMKFPHQPIVLKAL